MWTEDEPVLLYRCRLNRWGLRFRKRWYPTMRGGIGEGGTVVALVFLVLVGELTSWSTSGPLEVDFRLLLSTSIGCEGEAMMRVAGLYVRSKVVKTGLMIVCLCGAYIFFFFFCELLDY